MPDLVRIPPVDVVPIVFPNLFVLVFEAPPKNIPGLFYFAVGLVTLGILDGLYDLSNPETPLAGSGPLGSSVVYEEEGNILSFLRGPFGRAVDLKPRPIPVFFDSSIF